MNTHKRKHERGEKFCRLQKFVLFSVLSIDMPSTLHPNERTLSGPWHITQTRWARASLSQTRHELFFMKLFVFSYSLKWYFFSVFCRGAGVRELSKRLSDLLSDSRALNDMRDKTRRNRGKFSGIAQTGFGSDFGRMGGMGGGGGGTWASEGTSAWHCMLALFVIIVLRANGCI